MEEQWKIYKTTYWHNKKITYEVSNFGNVKKNGILIDLYNEYKHSGYLRFGSGYPVHRAVAELFIPNPNNKPTVDHIDTNTFNNNVSNLRWATYKEQQHNSDTIIHHREHSNKGKHWTDEQKKRISEGTKRAMQNPDIKRKMSENSKGNKYALGHRLTEEQKRNVSEGTKRAMQNPDIKRKMSENFKNKRYKWMTNGITNKLVSEIEQQHYIELGFYFGRIV